MTDKKRTKKLVRRKKAAETALYQSRQWHNKNQVSFLYTLIFMIGLFLPFAILAGLLYLSEGRSKPIVGELEFNVLFGLSGVVIFSFALYLLRFRLFSVEEKSSHILLLVFPWLFVSMIIGPIAAFSVNLDRSGEHNYAYRRIQELFTRTSRKFHRGTSYHAKILVGEKDVDLVIPREIYEKAHVGGCLDVCIHNGRLGVQYIDGIELPYTVRHRISCPAN